MFITRTALSRMVAAGELTPATQLETRSGDEMLRGDIEYSAHALLTARHAFCPPNPKEFDRASSSPGASRGPSGT